MVHFGLFVYAFAFMADRRSDLVTCARDSARLAAGAAAPGSGRLSDLARHLLFSGAVLVVVVIAASFDLGTSFPFLLVLVGPLATCVLTAWYAHRAYPTESLVEGAVAGEESVGVGDGEPSPAPRKKRAAPRRARTG